jgi:hypothetical protein
MAGNAAWFAFVHDAYGPTAVRLTLQEIAASRPIRRAPWTARSVAPPGSAWSAAFREFQVWSALVGAATTGRHFAFAGAIDGPRDAASAEGLPALSVQSDPPWPPWGPPRAPGAGRDRGGLSVRFEGRRAGLWEADLLVHFVDGRRHLVPLALDEDGSGEITSPGGIDDVLLLVRNLARQGSPRARTLVRLP